MGESDEESIPLLVLFSGFPVSLCNIGVKGNTVMIDYGTYQVQKDEDIGNFVVVEQTSGKRSTFNSISDVVRFIEQDLEDVDNGNG